MALRRRAGRPQLKRDPLGGKSTSEVLLAPRQSSSGDPHDAMP